jgi:ribonuclease R
MHENKEDELLIGVHVVDINSFIPKDSILDKEARRRSFSVYLNHIKTTFPLFPENLIEKISLGEYKDRPAISLFIRSSLESNVEEFFIKKTIIRNKKQFTYSEVNEILFEQNGEFLTDLQLLVEITSQFKSNRILRGSINLDFMPDNIADQIISELMIMANRLVGFHLQALPGQKVFRNQHIQSYTYLLLQNNFAALGYKFDILNKNPLTDINRILQEAALKGESELIMAELRNHMSNAYYSHSCTGHEALGTKWYTQWTSPLRKYMDLVVHRLLDKEFVDDLQNLCQYSSAVERLLKIRIETTNSNNFFDKINSFVSEGKELTIKLLKITPRHIILSTNQDFHLFVANSTDIDLVNSEKGNFDEFLQLLHSDLLFKIKFINVTKDRKDVFVLFLPSIDEESNLKIGQIKAKVIFSYD